MLRAPGGPNTSYRVDAGGISGGRLGGAVMAFYLEGTYVENCTCDVICPYLEQLVQAGDA